MHGAVSVGLTSDGREHLMQQRERGENAGHRKEREDPVQQPSAQSSSDLLLSAVSPAPQSVATTRTFALLSGRTVTASMARGPRYSCRQLWLGRNQERGGADGPLCVRWGPGGEPVHPRHSPGSWCRRTEQGEHAALSAVGTAATPALHSRSILWDMGPEAA